MLTNMPNMSIVSQIYDSFIMLRENEEDDDVEVGFGVSRFSDSNEVDSFPSSELVTVSEPSALRLNYEI